MSEELCEWCDENEEDCRCDEEYDEYEEQEVTLEMEYNEWSFPYANQWDE
jgi:hypothetical protein